MFYRKLESSWSFLKNVGLRFWYRSSAPSIGELLVVSWLLGKRSKLPLRLLYARPSTSLPCSGSESFSSIFHFDLSMLRKDVPDLAPIWSVTSRFRRAKLNVATQGDELTLTGGFIELSSPHSASEQQPQHTDENRQQLSWFQRKLILVCDLNLDSKTTCVCST